MNDHELRSLVGAVRGLLDERDLVQRALVENLKGEVEKLRGEVKALRGADERAERLLRAFTEQLSNALPVAVVGAVERQTKPLTTRMAALEQRALPTAGAAQ
jgi:hypothetical protein